MVKEAMIEATSSKKIVFALMDSWDYHKLVRFEKGCLYLYTCPSEFNKGQRYYDVNVSEYL
jgi:hypothetical protein